MKNRRKDRLSFLPRGELSFDVPGLNLDVNMPELDLAGFELPESFPEFEFDPDIFGGGNHEQHDAAKQG